jgi:AcrR family transcriptional regulator
MRTANKLRPRTKPPEERRDELTKAAKRLFLEQGVGPTTIEQITSGADVAKGTFYLYFSSKDEVLAALRERFAQDLLAGIKTAVTEKPDGDWNGKLAAWAAGGVAGYLESIRLHDILFYGSPHPAREGLINNIVIDYLAGLLQAGVDAGAWSIDDARFTAVFMFNGLHGVVELVSTGEKRVNQKRLTQKLERLCFRAVGIGRD